MQAISRRLFWLEMCIAAFGLVTLLLTLLAPRWIELVFHVDPDHGSGAFEWAITLVSLLVAITAGCLAGREWRLIALAGPGHSLISEE